GAQANDLRIGDPGATLEVTGPVGISAHGQHIAGVLTVASTTNAGTIDVTSDGVLVSGAGTFVNTGVIIVNGATAGANPGTLDVEGAYTTANLGSIANGTGGQVVLKGTLDNTGSVFRASDYGPPGGNLKMDHITILGGTLDFGTFDVRIAAGLLE